MTWIALAVLLVLAWMAFKAISLAVKVGLWVGMAIVAWWLFSQAFAALP